MMAFERTRDRNELKRPETSKYSRASKRSQFNMTMNNFNVTNRDNATMKKKLDKKTETQVNFYARGKTSSSKNEDFIDNYAFSDTYGFTQVNKIKKQGSIPDKIPNINSDENSSVMTSSMGFNMNSFDVKKGVTLDKVLGGGFKKIRIFDAGLDEFDDKIDQFPDPPKKKTNRASSPNEEEQKNFDILETENEEEGRVEKTSGYLAQNQNRDLDLSDRVNSHENTQIRDKLEKKYKISKTVAVYKRKSKLPPKPEASYENFETEINDSEAKNDDGYQEAEIVERGRDSALSKSESKSMSPKMSSEMKKNRFQSMLPDKQKMASNIPKYTMNMINDGPFGIKRVPYDPQSDPKSQTQHRFRISSNKFRSTKENVKTEEDNSKANYAKKPLQIKALINNELNQNPELARERKVEYEYERTTSRSSSVANADKFMENSRRSQGEKVVKVNVEQKLTRENRMIAEKIKKAEQDIMHKYSKMFHFNSEEVNKLKTEKLDDGNRKLPTPLKDFDSVKFFQKKFVNS